MKTDKDMEISALELEDKPPKNLTDDKDKIIIVSES